MKSSHWCCVITVLALSFGLTGCGKVRDAADRAKTQNDLKELGLAYIAFQDAESRPPKSFEELSAHSQKMGQPLSAGVSKLTVIWGAGMAGLCKDGSSAEIIVANGPATNQRVPVLVANGAVMVMTSQEFDSAKKAKPINR